MAKKSDSTSFQAVMSEVKLKDAVNSQDGSLSMSVQIPLKAVVDSGTQHSLVDLMGNVKVTIERVQGDLNL